MPIPSINCLSLEDREKLKTDALDALFCQQVFGESVTLTKEEEDWLRDNHGPCGPIEGPHTDECNMLECMVTLAKKRRLEKAKHKANPDSA